MKKQIGFIGCGNMAQAMIKGILEAKLIAPEDIIVSNKSPEKLQTLATTLHFTPAKNNTEVAQKSELLFLAIKPLYMDTVIHEIADSVRPDTVIISIVLGYSLQDIARSFGKDTLKIITTMPNTPAMVGAGMTAVCPNEFVTEDELSHVINLLESFGKAEFVPENLMPAVVATSGSSPAYVYLFIEAMADAAVLEGMPREKAYEFAAMAVLGSAKMVLETGMHPGVLKDMVCSPGGSTIAAISSLEESGLRGTIMKAMHACAEKARKK